MEQRGNGDDLWSLLWSRLNSDRWQRALLLVRIRNVLATLVHAVGLIQIANAPAGRACKEKMYDPAHGGAVRRPHEV